MIHIRVEYVGNSLYHLVISGHGGGEYGKDVICAGVSSCLIGALNALNDAENYQIVVQEGYGELKQIHEQTKHDEIVLETLVVQLETIRNAYPDKVIINVSGKEGKQ